MAILKGAFSIPSFLFPITLQNLPPEGVAGRALIEVRKAVIPSHSKAAPTMAFEGISITMPQGRRLS